MYYDFYQFKENPFNMTADPSFFFSSKHHSEAILNLEYGVKERKGIIAVTGEVGTGKTTLCRQLLNQFNSNIKFALILNPIFSELQLLQVIIQDLGLKVKSKSKFALMNILNNFLINESANGNNIVLLIDEAQNLSVRQLEQLRLLSNLETDKAKLLQIILVGQPELYDKLKLPALRQLRQRIAIHYELHALNRKEVQAYIHYRINKASQSTTQKKVVFDDAALDIIYKLTNGTPRTINILCDRALVAGFASENYFIDADIINQCAKEVLYFEHHL